MLHVMGVLAMAAILQGCASDMPSGKALLKLGQTNASDESGDDGSAGEAGSEASGSLSSPTADAPVPTGGTFLFCQEDLSLPSASGEAVAGCRLQDKNGEKITAIAALEPQFSVARSSGEPLNETERNQVRVEDRNSSASPWHWEVRYPQTLAPLRFAVRITHLDGTQEALDPATVLASIWRAKPGVELNVQPLQYVQGGLADGTTSAPNAADIFLVPSAAPIQLVSGQVQKALLRMTFRNEGASVGSCEYASEKDVDKLTVLTCTAGLMAGKDIRITAIDVSLRGRPLLSGVVDDGVVLQFRLLGHSVPAVERRP